MSSIDEILHNGGVRSLQDILAHLFHPRRSNNHRPRVIHPESFFFFILIVGGFVALIHLFSSLSGSGQNILGYASSITPKEVITATNQQRQQLGLSQLRISQELTEAALAKGQDMFSDQYWSHTSPDGTEPWYFMQQAGYSYKVAGENLARDFAETDTMVQAWMASPTHRANIVNPQYQEIGIAVIDGTLEGYETTLVVQMFGSPAEQSPQISNSGGDTMVRAVQAAGPVTGSDRNGVPAESPTAVLASMLVPSGEITAPPLFTPLQLTKAFFLAVIMMIVATLIYDTFVIGHRRTVRMVGQNLAHIFLFIAIAFIVIFFKGGIVG